MAPQLRPFRLDDAPALAELTLAAIVTLGIRTYSVKQTLSWAARHPGAPRFVDGLAKGDLIFVALADDDAPAAYALMEPDGHIDMLYCHPDHAGKGLATALLTAVEDAARQAGITLLFTEASELARPVFERAGFVLLHRRDFVLSTCGEDIAIHNYAMEKRLD